MSRAIPLSLLLASTLVPFALSAQTQIWSAPATQAAPPQLSAPARVLSAGEAVMASSSGSWYRATVLEVGPAGYKVRYEGWGAGWDEWLPPARLRLPDGAAVALPPSGAATPVTIAPPAPASPSPRPPSAAPAVPAAPGMPDPAPYQVGELVWVYWTGTSHKARILQARDGQYLIRYEGYDSKWDEWVGPGRIGGKVQGAAVQQGSSGSASQGSGSQANTGSKSPTGRWECATWDYGQLNRIGGFTLNTGGSYKDQNSGETGRYTFEATTGRIAFTSGPQKINVPVTFQPDARNGAGMIVFDYGGGARLDCYRAAAR